MREVVPNKWVVRCRICFDFLASGHRHDFRYCGCRATFVDGGNDYLRCGSKEGIPNPRIYRLVEEETEV